MFNGNYGNGSLFLRAIRQCTLTGKCPGVTRSWNNLGNQAKWRNWERREVELLVTSEVRWLEDRREIAPGAYKESWWARALRLSWSATHSLSDTEWKYKLLRLTCLDSVPRGLIWLALRRLQYLSRLWRSPEAHSPGRLPSPSRPLTHSCPSCSRPEGARQICINIYEYIYDI